MKGLTLAGLRAPRGGVTDPPPPANGPARCRLGWPRSQRRNIRKVEVAHTVMGAPQEKGPVLKTRGSWVVRQAGSESQVQVASLAIRHEPGPQS